MTETTTILVPIRYPLTAASTQTLEHAANLAREHERADLIVLHVNLFQSGSTAETIAIRNAVEAVIDDLELTTIVRSGFLVEEIILDEARQYGADIVVIGEDQRPRWRRYVSRLLGNEPTVKSFLVENLTTTVEAV